MTRASCLVCVALASATAWAGPDPPVESGAAKPARRTLAARSASNIFVIPFRGQTDELNYHALKRRLANAADAGADLVVIDLDSPGGPVSSSISIAKLIGGFDKVPIVVYVSGHALSGGAMAALGSPTIVMGRSSTIGASQPVMMTPNKDSPVQPAPEKAVSVVRAVVRTHAQNNGYPSVLCEAMVDPSIRVHEVDMVDGTKRYVDQNGFEGLEQSDAWDNVKGHRIICAKDKLLTLTEKEALAYGIAKLTVAERSEVIDHYGVKDARVTEVLKTPGEQIIDVINAPVLTSLLMLVGLGSLYFALKTPGFGVPETLAIACFAVFFFSKAVVGQADVLEIAMFVVGLALIALEIFVIPGFGVVGIAGVLMVVVSLVLALQDFTVPSSSIEWGITVGNVAQVMVAAVLATLGFFALVPLVPHTPGLRRLVHQTAASAETGYVAQSGERHGLVGSRGVAITHLRPAGRVEIAGEVLDVVTQGELIDAGDPVRVCQVNGNRIIVDRA